MPAAYEIRRAYEMCCAHEGTNFISYFAAGKIFHNPKDYFILRSNILFSAVINMNKDFRVIRMKENKLVDLSMDFSVKILKLCETVKGHYSLVNQLERSATSIGANIHEANYAHGKADFIAKLQISLKECYETEYWLELFEKAELTDPSLLKPLFDQCGTIRRILIASINTAKQKNGQSNAS